MLNRFIVILLLVGFVVFIALNKINKQKTNNQSAATQQSKTPQAGIPTFHSTSPSPAPIPQTQINGVTSNAANENASSPSTPLLQASDAPSFKNEQNGAPSLEDQLKALPNANQSIEEKNEAKKRAVQEFNAQLKASQAEVGVDPEAARWNALNAKRADKIRAQEAARKSSGE